MRHHNLQNHLGFGGPVRWLPDAVFHGSLTGTVLDAIDLLMGMARSCWHPGDSQVSV